MSNEFVSYEIALKLKELGFDEPCICGYNSYQLLKNKYSSSFDDDFVKWDEKYDKDLKAPLYQQVFRWFREKYGLEIILRPDAINAPEKKLREYVILSYDKSWMLEPILEPKWWIRKGLFKTYEEAQKECILDLISIIKNQKK
jgi:hypothetical protein